MAAEKSFIFKGLDEVAYGLPDCVPLDIYDAIAHQLLFPKAPISQRDVLSYMVHDEDFPLDDFLKMKLDFPLFNDCTLAIALKQDKFKHVKCHFADEEFMKRFVCSATHALLDKVIQSPDQKESIDLNIVSFATFRFAPLMRVITNFAVNLKTEKMRSILNGRKIELSFDSIDPSDKTFKISGFFSAILNNKIRGELHYFTDSLVLKRMTLFKSVDEYKNVMMSEVSDGQVVCLGYGFNVIPGFQHNVDYACLLSSLLLHRKNTRYVLAHVSDKLEKLISSCDITDREKLKKTIEKDLQFSGLEKRYCEILTQQGVFDAISSDFVY